MICRWGSVPSFLRLSDIFLMDGQFPLIDAKVAEIRSNRKAGWRDDIVLISIIITPIIVTGRTGAIPAHFVTVRA